jgi:hypothetical protein
LGKVKEKEWGQEKLIIDSVSTCMPPEKRYDYFK